MRKQKKKEKDDMNKNLAAFIRLENNKAENFKRNRCIFF